VELMWKIIKGDKYNIERLEKIRKVMDEMYSNNEYIGIPVIAKDLNVSGQTVRKYIAGLQKDKDVERKLRMFIKRMYKKNQFYNDIR
jgi:HTH domain